VVESSRSENTVRTVPPPDHRRLEIACDESGYEGEKLIGGTTDVFAHASVTMDFAVASECVHELRDRIRSPALEYKANHVLRTKHRSVLTWLLGPAGPLIGRAHVYLVEKSFLIVVNAVRLLVGQPDLASHAPDVALVLYRAGQGFDPDAWRAFLTAANDLMRIKDRLDMTTPVDSFFRAIADLRVASTINEFATATDHAANEVLAGLSLARPRAEAFRSALRDGRDHGPRMDPLIPAIVRAVDYWSCGASPVAVIHDRQNTLSGTRVERLTDALRVAAQRASGPGRVSELRFVDSRDDPRVQVADFLAGVARKKASEELNGRPDDEITMLLRPYVDSMSIWADDRSWRRLRPSSNVPAGH
jgi:hypothetical protein